MFDLFVIVYMLSEASGIVHSYAARAKQLVKLVSDSIKFLFVYKYMKKEKLVILLALTLFGVWTL